MFVKEKEKQLMVIFGVLPISNIMSYRPNDIKYMGSVKESTDLLVKLLLADRGKAEKYRCLILIWSNTSGLDRHCNKIQAK